MIISTAKKDWRASRLSFHPQVDLWLLVCTTTGTERSQECDILGNTGHFLCARAQSSRPKETTSSLSHDMRVLLVLAE